MTETLTSSVNFDRERLTTEAAEFQVRMTEFFAQDFNWRVGQLPAIRDYVRNISANHLDFLPDASRLNPVIGRAIDKTFSIGWATSKEGKSDDQTFFLKPWVGTYSELALNPSGLVLAHLQNLDEGIKKDYPDLTGPVLTKAVDGLHVYLGVQEGKIDNVESVADQAARRHLTAVLGKRTFVGTKNRLVFLPDEVTHGDPKFTHGIFLASNGALIQPEFWQNTYFLEPNVDLGKWFNGGEGDMIFLDFLKAFLEDQNLEVPKIIRAPEINEFSRAKQ